MRSSALVRRLLTLYAALQSRETTFGQVFDLSAACGIDGRLVLAEHFRLASTSHFRNEVSV